MHTLYSTKEFELALPNDKLPLKCYHCHNTFYVAKRRIESRLKSNDNACQFCSVGCSKQAIKKTITSSCTNCGKIIHVKISQHKKSKTGNNFCSKNCAGTYNNTHKSTGNRRSKLEIWLEEQLKVLYPTLKMLFNNKETINSELDIYIPSLNLAIELNGIFHYEPIYGQDKLSSIKNNDNRKFQACLEQNIELVIIDVSGQKYFKETSSKKYLNIIQNIINIKLESNQKSSS